MVCFKVGTDAGGPRKDRAPSAPATQDEANQQMRVCRFDKHNPKAEDLVDILNSKPNKMRSYQKMVKAKSSK